jgi:hypothetical protein
MRPTISYDVLVTRLRHISRKIVAIGAAVSLCGCQSGPDTEPDAADKAAAETKLQQMLGAKERQQHAEEAAVERKRQADQRAAEADAARWRAAQKPRYAPARLGFAARPRTWASITVPDLNVKAVFNSSWTNDQLNYRVALLGERAAINTFLGQHRQYGVNFADQSGNKIFEFPLSPEAFNWAPPNFNGGIPTIQTTGAIPLELPVYEQSVQWNLTWGS